MIKRREKDRICVCVYVYIYTYAYIKDTSENRKTKSWLRLINHTSRKKEKKEGGAKEQKFRIK